MLTRLGTDQAILYLISVIVREAVLQRDMIVRPKATRRKRIIYSLIKARNHLKLFICASLESTFIAGIRTVSFVLFH